MFIQRNCTVLFAAVLTGVVLTACSNGGGSSAQPTAVSSGSLTASSAPAADEQPTVTPEPEMAAPVIDFDSDNFADIAQRTLRSLLHTGGSIAALNRGISASLTQSQQLIPMLTGVVVETEALPCVDAGSYAMSALILAADGDPQLDFEADVDVSLKADFDACRESPVTLSGLLTLDYVGLLDRLQLVTPYDFEMNVATTGLAVQQQGGLSYGIDTALTYHAYSQDGEFYITEVRSQADAVTVYDGLPESIPATLSAFDFRYKRAVDSSAYWYVFNGEYQDESAGGALVQFTTASPLGGYWPLLPSSGSMLITGADSLIFIAFESDGSISLELLDLAEGAAPIATAQTNWTEISTSALP